MTTTLQNKVDRAIRLIQYAVGNDIVEVSYSGGKDSDVILELTKMSGVKFRAIYKNTTIDPPQTISHCKAMGAEIVQPGITFLKLVEKKGFPTMRARFCCDHLKEYKILDKAIQGIRRSESVKRNARYSEDDPVICRIYGSKKNHVSVILPILSWTDEDVTEFIKERSIKCHPLYYRGGNLMPPEGLVASVVRFQSKERLLTSSSIRISSGLTSRRERNGGILTRTQVPTSASATSTSCSFTTSTTTTIRTLIRQHMASLVHLTANNSLKIHLISNCKA